MDRRDTVVALLSFGAMPFRSIAQQAGRIPRVGLLGVTSAATYARQVEAMRKGFRDLGYIEGRNMIVDYRWAEGRLDRLPALAAELIHLQPDVLVTSGVGTGILKQATTTIPIVMAAGFDAVASGLIASLARPGGNITGSTFFGPELASKRLEMLKEAAPGLRRIAVLLNPAARDFGSLDMMRKTAVRLQVELFDVPARSPSEFDEAFALIRRHRADGIFVSDDSMIVANMRRLGELSSVHRLPGAGSSEFAEGGGLLVFGVNFPELWGRAPVFVDKILKGAKPVDLPVERPTRFELVINMKTAKSLGLAIPQSLLVRADNVIR